MKIQLNPIGQILKDHGLDERSQWFVAQEAIRLMRKYTPQDTGVMASSAVPINGGKQIRQTTPYARRQYYQTGFRHRGVQSSHWFEVMKQNGGIAKIKNGLKRYVK